jgi:hypothetical protein
MSDSNRVQVQYIEEATPGTTPAIAQPGTPQSTLRVARITGESIMFAIANTTSAELRADRMVSALVQTGAQNGGDLNFELSFPAARTFLDQMFGSALAAQWTNTPEFFNLTADATITDAGTVANTFAVVSGGTAMILGHLVQSSGFTNAANNQVFKVASSTGTTVVGAALGLIAETVPPAGARLKVVGCEGVAGDITATASGLACTALNFLNLGVVAGMWVKVGSTVVGNQFANTANNDWIRVTAVTATTITADNLPSGWAVDAGAGKTIRLWFGDILRNGVAARSFTLEKQFLDLTVPVYAIYRGMQVGSMNMSIASGSIISGSFSFLGTTHVPNTAAIGAGAAATTSQVMNAVANVARISEGGAAVTGPNFVKSLTFNAVNNLREQPAVSVLGLAGVGMGRFDVKGSMQTYFGSKALYDKYVASTQTSVSNINALNGQAVIVTLPAVKFDDGKIVASGANQDVMCDLTFTAIRDPATNCELDIQRVEYFL